MPNYRVPTFEYELLEMLDTNRLNMGMSPIVLGGSAGAGGGDGSPPGGFIGTLNQTFVSYDITEDEVTTGSASLLDNLNHIRYRIASLEAGIGGAFTQGSVPFGSSSGSLTQNNAALFWDDANETLLVGRNTSTYVASAPGAFKQAWVGDGAADTAWTLHEGHSDFIAPGIFMARTRGTIASPLPIEAADVLGDVRGQGWNGAAFADGPSVKLVAFDDFSSGSAWAGVEVWVTPRSTDTSAMAYRVDKVLSSGSMVWTDSNLGLESKSLEQIVDGSTITVVAGLLKALGSISRKRLFWNGA